MCSFDISFMERNDIKESAKVLSTAMLNNPLHVAVFEGNGENERVEIETMFLELFSKRPGIVFIAKEGKKIVGVMRMNSCTGKKINGEVEGANNRKDTNVRKSAWLTEWAKRDPEDQHWHLGPIGVLPSHQRLGVGAALMSRFCEEVDRCRATAYLETDSDENVLFYTRFGFHVISTSNIFGVENRYMLRERQNGR